MPVLSTTYSSYTPTSLSRNSSGLSSLIRPYSSSSYSKSRSSYDLINHHRPSSYLTNSSTSSSSSSNSSISSYKSPSSYYSPTTSSYYNNSRYSSKSFFKSFISNFLFFSFLFCGLFLV